MTKSIIGCGKFSKYHFFILGTVAIKTVQNFIFHNELSPKNEIGILGVAELSGHIYIQYLFKYISFIIGGIIFEYITKKNMKIKKDRDNKNSERSIEKDLLNPKVSVSFENMGNDKNLILEVIKICSIYCICHEIVNILSLFNIFRLDYSCFKTIYVIFFMKLYFVINIYNFKKIAIIIIIVPATIILMISSFLPFTNSSNDKSKDRNVYEDIKEITGSEYYSILFVFAYIIMNICVSYSRVKAKVLMDLKYISRYMIIFYVGICGTILILIILITLSFIKCNESMENLCNVKKSNNSTELYIDNIEIYFNNIFEKKDNTIKN